MYSGGGGGERLKYIKYIGINERVAHLEMPKDKRVVRSKPSCNLMGKKKYYD
jgi:hypothetical protein